MKTQGNIGTWEMDDRNGGEQISLFATVGAVSEQIAYGRKK